MQCKSLWIKASAKCINVNVNYPFLLNRFLLFWAIPMPKVRLFSMLNSILLISGGNGQKSRGGEGSFIIDPLCFIIKKGGE